MLPDEKIGCHRTGFQMSCYDGVTKHRCQLWCHVSGTDAMNQPVDVFGCSDALEIKMVHELSGEVRKGAASMDKVATETEKMRDGMTARDVQMVNAVRANILHLVETDDGRRWQRALDQAGHAGSRRITGYAHASGLGGAECVDPGDGGLFSQGAERDSGGGEDGNPEAA